MKDFKFTSDDDLLKQVKKDIDKELRKIKSSKKKKPVAKEVVSLSIEDALEKERRLIQNMTPLQLGEWLMTQHNHFVEIWNTAFNIDCMECGDYDSRTFKILYMSELNNLLHALNIEEFPQETINFLDKQDQIDLLIILRTLGFIS